MKQNKIKIIGITGGIGSGKSEVVKILAKDFKAYTIIADDVAKRLSEKGNISYQLIVDCFGSEILLENGDIDRSKLAETVFKNNKRLSELNAYVHPFVKEAILKEVSDVKSGGVYAYIVIEAALLVDDGFKDICDELWYIFSDENIRRKRLKASRNYSEDKIDSIIENQPGESAFKNACDRIIINNTNLEDLSRQIKEYLN